MTHVVPSFLIAVAGALAVAPLDGPAASSAAAQVRPMPEAGALAQRNVLAATFDCARYLPGHGATSSERRTIDALLAAMGGPNGIIGRRYCQRDGDRDFCEIGATGPHRYRERRVQFEFRVLGDCAQFDLSTTPRRSIGSRGGTRVVIVEESGIVRWSLRVDNGQGPAVQTGSHFYYHLRDPAGAPPAVSPNLG